jgi:hypothetical protein
MSYIGSNPQTQSFISGTDYFNGDGSTTAFTLSRSVVSPNDIEAVINNVVQQPNSAYTVSGTTITFTSAPSSGTSNIYVRYLSTTTQSITPSQGTVGNSQFANNISAIPMTYGTIGAGDASIMKNRIINGAMVISQRNGTSSVTLSAGADQYVLDRYDVQNNTTNGAFTCQQVSTAPAGFVKSTKITVTATEASPTSTMKARIWQAIEGLNCTDLAWGTADAKTVTLSFWVQSSVTGTFGGSLGNGSDNRAYPFTYTISSANTWEQKSITIAGDTTGTWATDNTTGILLNISLLAGTSRSGTAGAWNGNWNTSATGATNLLATNGATFYITGVQLEVGSSATGFEYVNYQTSLANCQRYAIMITGAEGDGSYIRFASGQNYSTTATECAMALPVKMRTYPSLTSGTASWYQVYANGGGNVCNTAPALRGQGNSPLVACLESKVASGLTTGQACSITANGTTSAYLLFTAEL